MKIKNSFIKYKAKMLPAFIVIGVLLFAGSIAFAFSPHSPLVAKQSEISGKTNSYNAKATQVPLPSPDSTSTQQDTVLGAQTRNASPKPTITQKIVAQQESRSTTAQTTTSSSNSQTAFAPTQIPVPQQAAPTAVQTAAQTVSVEIKTPDSSPKFTIDFNEGMNVCDVLQKAKDTGKISSVTFDDSYMATLHSKYVSEINGFSDNWTFSINGNSPLGCSLSQPKPNDSIVWKFG